MGSFLLSYLTLDMLHGFGIYRIGSGSSVHLFFVLYINVHKLLVHFLRSFLLACFHLFLRFFLDLLLVAASFVCSSLTFPNALSMDPYLIVNFVLPLHLLQLQIMQWVELLIPTKVVHLEIMILVLKLVKSLLLFILLRWLLLFFWKVDL